MKAFYTLMHIPFNPEPDEYDVRFVSYDCFEGPYHVYSHLNNFYAEEHYNLLLF